MNTKEISIKWLGFFIDNPAHAFAKGNYAMPSREGRESVGPYFVGGHMPRPKLKHRHITQAQVGGFILACVGIAKCSECHEPLTDEENLDEQTICDDCYMDYARQKLEDSQHPDCTRGV